MAFFSVSRLEEAWVGSFGYREKLDREKEKTPGRSGVGKHEYVRVCPT
jgi:hypothetical protein